MSKMKIDSKTLTKIVITLIVVEAVVICFLAARKKKSGQEVQDGSLPSITMEETGTKGLKSRDTHTDLDVAAAGETGIDAMQEYEKDTAAIDDVDMLEVYKLVLMGDFVTQDGYQYHFGADGEFAGFFDAGHPNVTGCTYQLAEKEAYTELDIYNDDLSSIVRYYLTFDAEGNIILSVPDTDVVIQLEAD